jgi:hypothetical protein
MILLKSSRTAESFCVVPVESTVREPSFVFTRVDQRAPLGEPEVSKERKVIPPCELSPNFSFDV